MMMILCCYYLYLGYLTFSRVIIKNPSHLKAMAITSMSSTFWIVVTVAIGMIISVHVIAFTYFIDSPYSSGYAPSST